MSQVPFYIGQRLKRKRIHGEYGGNPQCGISVSAQVPCIFIFTGESGQDIYKDEFVSETEFVYSGQGKTGDQTFDRSTFNGRANASLRDHADEEVEVHLFEESAIDSTYVVYLGEYEYVDHDIKEREDDNDDLRDEIRFELKRVNEEESEQESVVAGKSLRDLAEEAGDTNPSKRNSSSPSYSTSKHVRDYALDWADGICQGCDEDAPFITSSGTPYLEVHHVFRLSDGGPDHPDAVIALCPNCHRKVHHSRRKRQFNQELVEKLRERARQETREVPDILSEVR